MGFLTLQDFREDLNGALGDRGEAGNKKLDRWINKAYTEVAFVTEQEWMKICNYFTTVKGQPSYAFPDDFFAMISLKDLTNDRRLNKVELPNYHLTDRDEDGRPKRYARRRDTLYLIPTPDGEYRIELFYYWNPPLLSSATSRSRMAHFYDHAIFLVSVRNAWLAKGDTERATFFWQAAQNYLREMQPERAWEQGEPSMGITVAHSEEDLNRGR